MSKSGAREAERQRLLAFTWVGALPLALDGEHIAEIEGETGDDAAAVDVFRILGVPCAHAREDRRAARMSHDGDRWLLLGDRVELGAIDSRAVLLPPPLLAGLTPSRGLVGFVVRAGILFSLFDPLRLMSSSGFATASKDRTTIAPKR